MKTNELYETVITYQTENRVFFQNAENWDVRRFCEMYQDEELILQDWFQRDYCWSKDQVAALVHTLIHTPTLLPEIVLIEINGKYYVADGHQRLRSLIREVLKNPDFKYQSKELTSSTKFYNTSPKNVNWKAFVRELERKTITVKVIRNNNLNEVELRNLKSYVFRKWNNGKSVNPAEKRGSFPSDLNISLVQTLKEKIDLETQKVLLVSNTIGRNNFNEFIEKIFYHFINPDATCDPKNENYENIHSIEFESIIGKINKFKSMFIAMSEVVKEHTDKNGKFWGACSLRDILTFVNSLYVKNEFNNITEYREYLTSILDTIHTTYIKNNKFNSYEHGIVVDINPEVNEFWYSGFFSFYGKGQDGKFIHRRNFLNVNKTKFGTIGNTDSKRLFNIYQKQYKYIDQNKKCSGLNGKECEYTIGESHITELEADHILEHSVGGRTIINNLQMLCKECHKKKTFNFITQKELLPYNVG
jgi:hypothetical protein